MIEKIPESEFSFRTRPLQVPADMRIEWRLAAVCIALHLGCRAASANLHKIIVLNWAMRNPSVWGDLLQVTKTDSLPLGIAISHDPSMQRALAFCLGEGLMVLERGHNFKLTESGAEFSRAILKTEAFAQERKFLVSIKSSLTNEFATRLLTWSA